jgi:hypothetical protein
MQPVSPRSAGGDDRAFRGGGACYHWARGLEPPPFAAHGDMTDRDDEQPALRDWLWALARLRPLWPLPALLFLGLVLPFSPALWVAPITARKNWSVAELSLACSAAGTLLYWLVLLLSHFGLVHTGGSRMQGMREPSAGELRLAELGLRWICLLLAYGGPLLVLLAP